MLCEVVGALLVLRGYVTVARVVFCEGIPFYCGADSRPVFQFSSITAVPLRFPFAVCPACVNFN